MGGGSKGSSQPQVPPEVRQLMRTVVPQQEAAMRQAPISSFLRENPAEIASFTPGQERALGSMESTLEGRLDGPALQRPEQESMDYYRAQVRQDPTSSRTVNAVQKALERNYQRTTLPTLKNEAALAGLATSGAYTDSVARSRGDVASAMVPVYLEQQARQERAAGALPAFGDLMEKRPTDRAEQLFEVGEQRRQLEQQGFDAAFQDYLRRQGIIENISNVTTGSLVPASFGQRSRTTGPGLAGLFTGQSK